MSETKEQPAFQGLEKEIRDRMFQTHGMVVRLHQGEGGIYSEFDRYNSRELLTEALEKVVPLEKIDIEKRICYPDLDISFPVTTETLNEVVQGEQFKKLDAFLKGDLKPTIDASDPLAFPDLKEKLEHEFAAFGAQKIVVDVLAETPPEQRKHYSLETAHLITPLDNLTGDLHAVPLKEIDMDEFIGSHEGRIIFSVTRDELTNPSPQFKQLNDYMHHLHEKNKKNRPDTP